MNKDFRKLKISDSLKKNIDILGFKEMTEIQALALPHVLEGKDVTAQAQTGSGKTVAFGLGVLNNVDVKKYQVQALVICPTRELASQVSDELRKLARLVHNLKVLTLFGGTSIGPQIGSLEHGAHIVVGTPGRLLDHIRKKTLSLKSVNTLVLDEADRMLDMGFEEDLSKILESVPPTRQTLLFSATFPEHILKMSQDIQNSPVTLKAKAATSNKNIEQYFYETKKEFRNQTLLALLAKYRPESGIIFCTTKIQCDEVATFLEKSGLSALAIHGDIEQYHRDEIMIRFANGSVSFLVATDVAARGLDIKNLSAVINVELSRDPEVHVHRIGRTGRAGDKGLALSIVTSSERVRLKSIEKLMEKELPLVSAPRKSLAASDINLKPRVKTLKIFGGKKSKLRPGDILGALTKVGGIEGKYIGKINITENNAYVAIDVKFAEQAKRHLLSNRIKNRQFGMKLIY